MTDENFNLNPSLNAEKPISSSPDNLKETPENETVTVKFNFNRQILMTAVLFVLLLVTAAQAWQIRALKKAVESGVLTASTANTDQNAGKSNSSNMVGGC